MQVNKHKDLKAQLSNTRLRQDGGTGGSDRHDHGHVLSGALLQACTQDRYASPMHRLCWWQEAAVFSASCALVGCDHPSADSLNPCFRDQVKNFQELSKKGYYDGTVVSAGLAYAVISHA